MAKTLYVIDGHSQMYRAYFAPFRSLSSPTGEPTRATYVFMQGLLKLLNDRKPDYVAMAVDGPTDQLLRRETFAEYKVTRKPMPDDLRPQIQRILQLVELMGIPLLQAPRYEADDVIATLAARLAGEGLDVRIVSGDKDLDQLLTPHVTLYDPMKDRTIDHDSLLDEKGYRPEQAVEVQTLCGDATDNVPGVVGVGPKTAVKLIAEYGSAEAVLANADKLTPKLRENVQAFAEQMPVTRELVTLDRDVPIDLDLDAMAYRGVRVDAIRPVFIELGFNRLLDQLDALSQAEVDETPTDAPPPAAPAATAGKGDRVTTADDYRYICVDTPEALKDLAKKLKAVRRLAVDTETTAPRPMWAELVGICLSFEPGVAYYIPVRGPLGATVLEIEDVRAALGPVLADAKVQKIGQNFKYDLIVLRNAGFEVGGEFFDTMVAAHVLDSTRLSYGIDALAMDYLGHRKITTEEIIGRGKNQTRMDAVAVDIVARYGAEDADATLRLADVMEPLLRQEGLADLLANLEMPLLPVLAEMEQTGVRVDPAALKRLELELGKQADVLRDRIVALAGRPFNPDSPKQLAEVLFGDLKLTPTKKTKTGPSTDSTVLEDLAADHELPGLVLEYRKLTKLLGTYLRALVECIHPKTQRIHTSFHQTGTVTGRLSSSDPNLQNIPIRTEQGRLVRSAFRADDGWLLLSADYSQVELRMLAHFCQDETLTAAFEADQDIHRIVAAEVFHTPPESVTSDQRAKAKTVNFGIIYGQTAFGLARTLRIGRTEAADFIRAYHKRFPKIEAFLAECVRQARDQGYVETIFGRRRRISDLDASNPSQRSAAERLAINSVVQGSAADLIKQAMVNLDRRLSRESLPAKMLLQIHDELVFEVPADAVDGHRQVVVEEMTGAIRLRVPLKVDVGVGENWMDAK